MGSGFDISAYVKNLTDKEYAVGGVQLYTTFGLTTKAYGDPRSYGVALRYKF
jgi:iron complex outermembrane receptor protein